MSAFSFADANLTAGGDITFIINIDNSGVVSIITEYLRDNHESEYSLIAAPDSTLIASNNYQSAASIHLHLPLVFYLLPPPPLLLTPLSLCAQTLPPTRDA